MFVLFENGEWQTLRCSVQCLKTSFLPASTERSFPFLLNDTQISLSSAMNTLGLFFSKNIKGVDLTFLHLLETFFIGLLLLAPASTKVYYELHHA